MFKRNPKDITDMFFEKNNEVFSLPEDAMKYFATLDKSYDEKKEESKEKKKDKLNPIHYFPLFFSSIAQSLL